MVSLLIANQGTFQSSSWIRVFSLEPLAPHSRAEYGLDLKRRKKIELSETEKTVFDLIKKSGEAFLPEIADKLNKPIAEITTVIMSLTIKGLAAGIGGNRYVAIQ